MLPPSGPQAMNGDVVSMELQVLGAGVIGLVGWGVFLFIRLKKAQAQLKALEQLMKEQNVQQSEAPFEEPKAQLKTFVEKQWEAQLNAWTEKLENELRLNARYIIRPEAKERVESAVFTLLNTKEEEGKKRALGVGFFFQKRRAVTCNRVLPELVKVGDVVAVKFLAPNKTMKLTVSLRDKTLDYAILKSEHQDAPGFLEPYTGDPGDLVGQRMGLCAPLVASGKDLLEGSQDLRSVEANGVKLLPNETQLLYEGNVGRNHSGGALVLFDGQVAGMHLESVEEIRQRRLAREKETDERDQSPASDRSDQSSGASYWGINIALLSQHFVG